MGWAEMTWSVAIVIGTLIAALAPLYAMYYTLKHQSDENYEQQLERRTGDAERRTEKLQDRVETLERENVRLMRELFEKRNG
jgi:predicted RNase H-like nuclease (RuvC/YqgF family)